MILFEAFVYKPWTDERNSGLRVTNLDHAPQYKRQFVLNPYLISEVTTTTTGTTFKYTDNFGDRREKPSTISCNLTVTQLKSIADTTANSNTIKLPIYKNNNRNNATTDTTILWSNIVYCDRYNPAPDNCCWVVYTQGAFKRKEVLVNLAIEDIVRLVKSGNTTRTFSTVHAFPGF